MSSTLLKSFNGAGLMQQVTFAPSNFGFDAPIIYPAGNVAANHIASALAGSDGSGHQLPQTQTHSSLAPHGAERISGPDLRNDLMVLLKHPKWLPCAVPGYREAHYSRQTNESSYLVKSQIVEPDDWVIVNVNLLKNDPPA